MEGITIFAFVAILLLRPLTILIHELGHGIAALLLTNEKVTIYLGSYGDPDSYKMEFGRLTFFLKLSLALWGKGACFPHQQNLSINRNLWITFFGPFASLLVGGTALYFAVITDLDGFASVFVAVLLVSCILDFIFNMMPLSEPIRFHDGTLIYNDGMQIMQSLAYKKLPQAYWEGIQFYNHKAYEKAIECFETVLANGCKKPDVYRTLIGTYQDLVDYSNVNKVYKEFEEHNDLTSDDYLHCGSINYTAKDYELAIIYLQKSLSLNYRNYLALNNLAYLYAHHGAYKEALEDLENAIAIEPSYPYAYNNRGFVKLKLGKKEEGLKDIKYALKLEPKNAYAYRNLGIYYFEEGDYESALNHFEKAYSLDVETDLLEDYLRETRMELGK